MEERSSWWQCIGCFLFVTAVAVVVMILYLIALESVGHAQPRASLEADSSAGQCAWLDLTTITAESVEDTVSALEAQSWYPVVGDGMEAVYSGPCRTSVEGWNSLPDETRIADIDNAPVPQGAVLAEDGSIILDPGTYYGGERVANELLAQRERIDQLTEEVNRLRAEQSELTNMVRQIVAAVHSITDILG